MPAPGERSAAPLLTLLAETAGQENITLSIQPEGDVSIPRSRFVAELKAAMDSAAEDARADRQKGDLLDRPLLFARRVLRHLNTAAEAYEQAKAHHSFDKRPLRRVLEEVGRAHKAFLEKLGG